MQGAPKRPFAKGEIADGCRPLYDVGKGPFAAREELPQWHLCSRRGSRKSFVIAGMETTHKGAVQVEKGTREW